jgi:hypothetical protein
MGSMFSDMERMHQEMENSFKSMMQPMEMDFGGYGSNRGSGRQFGS